MATTTVVGIGNTFMGDDGVGPFITRLIRENDHAGLSVNVIDRPNADMGMLKHFRESQRIIVIDGLDVGGEPGSVYRFTPLSAGMVSLRSNNIHGMGVGHVVASAWLCGACPDVIIYGVQVGDVRPNPDNLTPEVEDAARCVAELVEGELSLSQ